MSTKSVGQLYIKTGEEEPIRGESILIVPVGITGHPDWAHCTIGGVGDVAVEPVTHTNLHFWNPGQPVTVWEHRCEIALGYVDPQHIAIPLCSDLFAAVATTYPSALWASMARRASDALEQERALGRAREDLAAAKQERRGLEKRLQIERDCARGFFKAIVDPKAAERLFTHLDYFVGKIAPTAASGAEAAAEHEEQDEASVAAVRNALDGAHATDASSTLAVDSETVAFLQDLQGYLAYLAEGHMYSAQTFERLHNNCTAALARVTLQPAAAPAQPGLDPEVMEEFARIEQMLVGHVVGTRGIEATERVIADAVACLRVARANLHTQAVSPKATPVVPELLHELELIQRDFRSPDIMKHCGARVSFQAVCERLGRLIFNLRNPGAKATV